MYVKYNLTEEEFELIDKTLEKYREEKAKQEAIEAAHQYLRNTIITTIDAIGLEETKRIIRAINSDLRRSGIDNI